MSNVENTKMSVYSTNFPIHISMKVFIDVWMSKVKEYMLNMPLFLETNID